MTYQIAAQFAQTWGLLYAVTLFAAIVAYALWPANKATFDRAAQMPLDDDAAHVGEKSDV